MFDSLKQRIAAALLGAAILCSTAHAQSPTSRPAAAEQGNLRDPKATIDRLKEIAASLKLSDEQKTRVNDLISKAAADLKEMRADLEKLSPSDRGKQTLDFLRSVREQVLGELTVEQKKLFEQKADETRNRGNGDQANRAGPIAERLRQNLEKLELTEDQKTKIKSITDGMKEKIAAIREKTQPGTEAFQDQTRQAFKEMQQGINEVLTPSQQAKFRQAMGFGEGEARNRNQPAPTTGMAMKGEEPGMEMQMQMNGDKKAAAEKSANDEKVSALPTRTGPGVGQPAPSFELKKIDGTVVSLASLKGRIVVLEFGSYSCPVFRTKAPGMEDLKNQLGQRAAFLVVYTSEAHPAGKWDVERNKDAGISVSQPADEKARKTLATTARDKLKISIPIALDKMDNSVAEAFGLTPNGAVIIGRDGTIIAKQQWTDPYALRPLIEAAANAKPATRPAAQ